jgi:two-component system response regulator QseB
VAAPEPMRTWWAVVGRGGASVSSRGVVPQGRIEPVAREVMVVEDDQDILEVVSEALRDEGYAVPAFHDATSALAYAHDHQPALVLTDLLIPPSGGRELVAQLRDLHGPVLPIVLMTALRDRAQFADVPVQHVLPKPFELEELWSVVRRLATPTP